MYDLYIQVVREMTTNTGKHFGHREFRNIDFTKKPRKQLKLLLSYDFTGYDNYVVNDILLAINKMLAHYPKKKSDQLVNVLRVTYPDIKFRQK